MLFLGFLVGFLFFLDSSLEEGAYTEFSSFLFLGLIMFSGSSFIPNVSNNYFVDAIGSLILSFLIAYFLGPVFFQFLGGNELLGFGLVSILYIVGFISAFLEWKESKEKRPDTDT